MFGDKGNVFGEISCQYPETQSAMIANAYLNGTTIFSCITCLGTGWLCYSLVNYATKSTIG